MAISGYEISDIPGNSTAIQLAKGTYKFFIYINPNPTSNCQLSSIGSMNCLLPNFTGSKKDMRDIIKECYRIKSYPPLITIIDVRQNFCPKVEALFNVINKVPYTSTNGSLMCLYLVNLRDWPVE